MTDFELQFADDENGDPIVVPGSTKKITVKRHQKGQSGAPAQVTLNGKPFSVTPDAPADALAALPANSYRLQPYDAKGKRAGKPFYVEIVAIVTGDDTRDKSVKSAVDEERERFYEELRQERFELRAMLKDTIVLIRELAQKVLETQIEIAKAMPKTVEASATMLTAARGGGLSEVAAEVREIMESAPESGSNLETVLSSPVVVGAAAALQKYMAQAAQNSAEVAAEENNGRRGESMAQRVARMAAQAHTESLRGGK